MDVVETATNVIFVLEAAAALWLTWKNRAEVAYLEKRLKPQLRDHEDLPLLNVLIARARGVSSVGFFLIAVSAIGLVVLATVGETLASIFPPIRAINGLLALYLIAGPRQVGNALRPKGQAAESEQ